MPWVLLDDFIADNSQILLRHLGQVLLQLCDSLLPATELTQHAHGICTPRVTELLTPCTKLHECMAKRTELQPARMCWVQCRHHACSPWNFSKPHLLMMLPGTSQRFMPVGRILMCRRDTVSGVTSTSSSLKLGPYSGNTSLSSRACTKYPGLATAHGTYKSIHMVLQRSQLREAFLAQCQDDVAKSRLGSSFKYWGRPLCRHRACRLRVMVAEWPVLGLHTHKQLSY